MKEKNLTLNLSVLRKMDDFKDEETMIRWIETCLNCNVNHAVVKVVPVTKPRVLVTVRGGVAEYVNDDGVDVEVFDFDNYDVNPEYTDLLPAHFADLAAFVDAPVNEESTT